MCVDFFYVVSEDNLKSEWKKLEHQDILKRNDPLPFTSPSFPPYSFIFYTPPGIVFVRDICHFAVQITKVWKKFLFKEISIKQYINDLNELHKMSSTNLKMRIRSLLFIPYIGITLWGKVWNLMTTTKSSKSIVKLKSLSIFFWVVYL